MITPYGRRSLEGLRAKDLDPKLPWGGRSPRTLTRVATEFNLELRSDDVNRELREVSDEEVDEMCRRHSNGSSTE